MRDMLQQSLTYRQQMNSNNPLKARRLSEGSCWNGGEALVWDEQDNSGGGREGRELCERAPALAVSCVICPLISLTVCSNQDFFPLLSVLFCLSYPIPIYFYYSLTICISLSSSKQHFSENVQSERGEKAGDGLEDKVLGLVHGVSLLKRGIAVVCENSLLAFQTEIFPSLLPMSKNINVCSGGARVLYMGWPGGGQG